ncbi:MAG: sulfotransferase family protein [Crocinitomicaceae bacterium]|jgi:hypothetical protein|nr:sulfotransferase family protein [Crocinitomicaceae bacterium]
MDSTKRIFLWSGPRNISTTLMYSFAQRSDTKVFDEPLYGYYLSNSNANKYHPDGDLIVKNMECNGGQVVSQMIENNSAQVLFFKNMTHHLLNLDLHFMTKGLNIILTRDPVDMLPSFHKVIKNPSLEDVGYKAHVELMKEFDRRNISYLVMDSKQILENPEKALKVICEAANIPFYKEMLSWPALPRSEDGIWARHWYKNIHHSTGFMKYQKKKEEFPKQLEPLLFECQAYYNDLIDKIR